MSNIVPFQGGQLPAYAAKKRILLDVNKDIVTAAQYPTLSIKGKVFTLVQDNERKVLMKPDDPEEVAQSLNVAIIRINMGHKTYYDKVYVEGESQGQRPLCFSNDGVAPSPQSPEQQAKKCALCPHNVFGTARRQDGTLGAGKACSDSPRVAVADPDNLDKPMLLRVPPASIKNLRDCLKIIKTRALGGLQAGDAQYNMFVYRVGFVPEAASPTLTFRPVGLLSDEGYEQAAASFHSDMVRSIVGELDDDEAAEDPGPGIDTSELDAAIAAKAAAQAAAKSSARPGVKPAVPTAPKPPVQAAPAPVTEDDLMGVLDTATPTPPPAQVAAKAPAAKAAAKVATPPAAEADDLLAELDGLLQSTDD